MRSVGIITAAILMAASALGGLVTAPSASASKDDVEINGTYRATSLGDWAQTDDQYNKEPTVRSTWTISSSCATFQDCTGTVTSDQGWSAPLYNHDGVVWYVKRDVPNWERCDDGTAFTGKQTFYFYAVNSLGLPQLGSPTMAGVDRTLGPSGACGQNKLLDIDQPFRLDKIG